MGQALAKFGDIPTMKATQRESLVAFLGGVDRLIDRLVSVFSEDVRQLPEAEQTVAARVFVRAESLKANVTDELARLNDSAQSGPAWWQARLANGRRIAYLADELSEDMIGFLETGTIPSEIRARNEMIAFCVVATLIAGTGVYFWWNSSKTTDQSLSGGGEDCGCSLGG